MDKFQLNVPLRAQAHGIDFCDELFDDVENLPFGGGENAGISHNPPTPTHKTHPKEVIATTT